MNSDNMEKTSFSNGSVPINQTTCLSSYFRKRHPGAFSLVLSLKPKKLHERKVLATQSNFPPMERTPSYWNSATILAEGVGSALGLNHRGLQHELHMPLRHQSVLWLLQEPSHGCFCSADLWDLLVESFLKRNKELGARGVIKLKSYNFSKEKVAAEKEYTSIHAYPDILLCSIQKIFQIKIVQKMTSAIYYVNSQGVLPTQTQSIN